MSLERTELYEDTRASMMDSDAANILNSTAPMCQTRIILRSEKNSALSFKLEFVFYNSSQLCGLPDGDCLLSIALYTFYRYVQTKTSTQVSSLQNWIENIA
jgi:hypothetical protein